MLTVIVSPSSLYSIWPKESSPSKNIPSTMGRSSINRYETATMDADIAPVPETANPVVVTNPSLHMTNASEARKTIAITNETDVKGTINSSKSIGKYTRVARNMRIGKSPSKITDFTASTGPADFSRSSSGMTATGVGAWFCPVAFSSKPPSLKKVHP